MSTMPLFGAPPEATPVEIPPAALAAGLSEAEEYDEAVCRFWLRHGDLLRETATWIMAERAARKA